MCYKKDKGETKEVLLNKTTHKKTTKELKKRDESNTLPDPCVPPSPLHPDHQKEPFSPDEITPSKPHKNPIVSLEEDEDASPQ